MYRIELRETVNPEVYGDFCYSEEYTYYGHKYREVEMVHEDGVLAPIGTQVLTPKCGWIPDDTNPSLECKMCTPSCVQAQRWKEFYEEDREFYYLMRSHCD